MSTEVTPTNTTLALKEEMTPKTSSSDLKPILIPPSEEEAELIFERATYAGGIPLTRSPPTQFVLSLSVPMLNAKIYCYSMPEFAQTLPSHYLRTRLAFSFHDFLDVEESLSRTGSASGWALGMLMRSVLMR